MENKEADLMGFYFYTFFFLKKKPRGVCVCVLVHVLQTLAAFGRGEREIEGWGGVGRGHTDTHTLNDSRGFPPPLGSTLGALSFLSTNAE